MFHRRTRTKRPRRKENQLSWQFIQALPQPEKLNLSEAQIQMALVQYLKEKYPEILFKCDTSAVKLTPGQAVKMKKLGNTRAWPDLHIAEPRRKFYGMFLELKKEGERIRWGNGNFASSHIAEQSATIEKLNQRGYYAEFVTGFSDARRAIDWYLE